MQRTAEVICVGTELLLGDILNSNAQFLAQELARLGIAHYHQTVVGDNPERIRQVVAIAQSRAQLLIFTGGLGPTPDDLTHETLASCFGVPLVEHPEILATIHEKFVRRGIPMAPSNRTQALLPLGAEVLTNSSGTAPGIIWQPQPPDNRELTILTFPGVPTEMKMMWRHVAVPYLQAHGWSQQTLHSRMLKFWGISESALAEQVQPMLASTNPTVAPYANWGEVKLRIAAVADSHDEAERLIEPMAQKIRAIAPDYYYGCDQDTLASVVGEMLLAQNATLAIAESCTGGGIGSQITEIPGSSAYFVGGVIAYDNRVKIQQLGVETTVLERQGAVSAAVAAQMAQGVKQRLGATWGLSITGIAGPDGGTPDKPVGLVYIGVAGPQGVQTFEHSLGSGRGRQWVRQLCASHGLNHLRLALRQLPTPGR
jgi:nicotinamide-nucleotide amidase